MRLTICRECMEDRSPFSTVRRGMLAVAAILCVFGTIATFPVRAQPETSDQYRIAELERRANTTEQFGPRLAVVETHYEEMRDELADIKTWTRGIGMALLVAVLEKLLSAFGIKIRRRPDSDG